MALEKTMGMMGREREKLAIGLGCRKAVSAAAITALVRRALAQLDADEQTGIALFTIADKQDTRALYEAAAELALPLVFLPREKLAAASAHAATISPRVKMLFGLPSVAETAALAGAGEGARLIAPRITADGVTCAIARAPQSERNAP